jgi:hypothetical protein
VQSPFRGSDAIGAGLITREGLRTSRWLRLFRDVYVRSDAKVTHVMRCRAASLVVPATAAISGRSAACLHGFDAANADEPVEVTVDRQIRPRSGMSVRRAELPPADVVRLGGLRVTTVVRTAFDIARSVELESAVVAVDALLNRRGIPLEDVVAYAARRRSWPGSRRARDVLGLVASGAESPMETRLRLVLVRAGLPAPASQHRVRDECGFVVARLDLAYVEQRLGIEYDGEVHFDALAVKRDLRRQNVLRSLGWSLLRFTGDDVLRHADRLAAEVRSALGSTSSRV